MSYTELSDKFEFITSHIKKGPQIGGALCNLFKNYKKSLDLFSQQTLKNIDVFTADLPKDISSTTLEYALSSLISHFKKFAHQQSAFSRHFQTEVIDPLESFIVQNHDSNMNHLNKAAPHYKKLQKSIDNMQKLKEKHLQKSGESEKIEKLVDRNDHSKEQQKLYKNALQAKSNSFKASEIYEKSVQEANKLWDEYNSVMPGVLDGFQQNEESRIHFFKYSIEKYTNYYAKFSLNVTGIFEELNAALSNVDSEIDVKEFVEANKSKVIKKQEEFVSYEFYKRSKAFGIKSDQFNESEYEMLDDAGIQTGNDPDLELVKTVLNYLIPYRIDRLRDSVFTIDVPAEEEKEPNIDASYYGKLSELLHTVEGRELFCDVLESKNSNRCLEYSKITQLAALIKSLLTAMMMETDTDPITFCKLITFSDKFYTETPDDKKQFLSNLISSHCVWSDTNRWTQAIICAIQAKLEADGENSQQLGKRRKTGLFTTIKIIAKRIPAIFQKNLADERAEKAASFLVISQFNYHMIKLGVPVDTANSIILQVCQNVNLDSERTCVLLSEVLNTKRTSMMIEPDFSSSLKAREKERQKYGNLLQIGLALEFLEPKDCYALLLVCKQWKDSLYHQILKKWLTEWDLPDHRKQNLRSQAWIVVLKGNSRPTEYAIYVGKSSKLGSIEEVIDLDVIRCYQNHPRITHDILKRILKAYASFNPELGYCQGMNYVVGTLYVQLQDEDLTFKCLINMIEKFQMQNVYLPSLPKLKQFFYQLDRIIGIMLPDIHILFRETGLCSGHFSAPWFITVFSSTLQNKEAVLYKIWDLFLLEGWKIAFKVSIAVLSRLKREIKGKRFEDIMFTLTNINTPNCPVDVFDDRFLDKLQKIDISNALLRDLESEYEHLKIRAYNKHTKY